jgi:ribosomal protein S18 acetylase RimI-like enzyme
MSGTRIAIPLSASLISLKSAEFATISNWPYTDSFVQRLLKDDIAHRIVFGNCRLFLYHDPNKQPVGFGALDLCNDYSSMVGKALHPYIPLLAVNPTIQSLGYGRSILNHLIGEAAVLSRFDYCADTLFLEVYSASTKAKALYDRAGFQVIAENFDPIEKKQYEVMAKRVSPG